MQIPELIYCANGNRRFAEIAKKHGFLIGAQLPGTIYDVHKPLYFADQDFKKPRYVDYIKAIRKYQPYMASVLDLEEWRRMDEYLMRADEISRYCQVVMLIPKTNGVIKELPREINGKQVRLGYSVPTKFGGTTVPISEFQDWPVHLLGGSPHKQLCLAGEFNTISIDGNMAQLVSRYNKFWNNGKWLNLSSLGTFVEHDAPYEAFERSCKNIMEYWHNG